MPEKLISRFEQSPEHFLWSVDRGVATITLNRPERKNPLTFESYAEIRDRFRDLVIRNFRDLVIRKKLRPL